MEQTSVIGAVIDTPFYEFLQREREQSLSAREWKFRLAGHGYGIKEVAGRQVVTSLSQGKELGVVPTPID